MSKSRLGSVTKHGHSVCIPITKIVKELGWKPGDIVKVEPDGDHITITLVEGQRND